MIGADMLKNKGRAVSAQETQESMRFMFELMSKELRQAKRSDGSCAPAGNFPTSRIFNDGTNAAADGNILYFKNRDGQCVYYYIKNNTLMVRRGNNFAGGRYASTTPDEIRVSNLQFNIYDNLISAPPGSKSQPRVTFGLTVEMARGKEIHKERFNLQTTVSSRFYE